MAGQTRTRYRLGVSLTGSEPEIWRVLDADGSLRLDELHDAIQIALGWRDSHPHEFTEVDPFALSRALPRIGRRPRRWMPEDQLRDVDTAGPAFAPAAVVRAEAVEELLDERQWRVASVFDSITGPLHYTYDFGDEWLHRIELIESAPTEAAEAAEAADAADASRPPWARRVELVRGEQRGPVEDSGGVYGYRELMEAMADASSPGHSDAAAWVTATTWPAASFDPGAFDRDAVNHELALRFELDSDMSGLIVGGAPTAVTPDSPIVDLLDRLPVPLRSELRMRLRSAGALDPVSIETDAAARMTRAHAWLLNRIGDDGIALTKAGWLPPAVVHDGMTELGWIDDWIGTANREDNTVPIRALRASATRTGLARVLKGRLVTTAAGRKLRHDPVALWHHLAANLVARAGSDARSDATVLLAVEIACGGRVSFTHYGAAIASGLDALGWSLADGETLTGSDALDLVRDTWQALADLGVLRRKRWIDGKPTPEGQAFARAMLAG